MRYHWATELFIVLYNYSIVTLKRSLSILAGIGLQIGAANADVSSPNEQDPMTSSEHELARTRRDAEDSLQIDEVADRSRRLPRLGARAALGVRSSDKRLPRLGRERRLPRLGLREPLSKRLPRLGKRLPRLGREADELDRWDATYLEGTSEAFEHGDEKRLPRLGRFLVKRLPRLGLRSIGHYYGDEVDDSLSPLHSTASDFPRVMERAAPVPRLGKRASPFPRLGKRASPFPRLGERASPFPRLGRSYEVDEDVLSDGRMF